MYAKSAVNYIMSFELAKLVQMIKITLRCNMEKLIPKICLHRGRTDKDGGHRDWINAMGWGYGYYHYHHRLPAHLHPNQKCPYEKAKPSNVINPFTGKNVSIGIPYTFEGYNYYQLNLVAKALTANDEQGILGSTGENAGLFYACPSGDSTTEEPGEPLLFYYPDYHEILDNMVFETINDNVQLLAASDGDSTKIYIRLETVRNLMIKDGYFTDFSDNGSGVWEFEVRKPVVKNIVVRKTSPDDGDTFDFEDEVEVWAEIEHVTRASLQVGRYQMGILDGFVSNKSGLENQREVTFAKFKLTEDKIGIAAVETGILNIAVSGHTGGTTIYAERDFRTLSKSTSIHIGKSEEPGKPAITTDWLNLYSSPTVAGPGRHVAKHPNAANYDWGMPEELKGLISDNLLPVNARNVTGKTPIKGSNNGYIDDEGRYWVAVGPNVMNPNYNNTSKVTDNDMQYGTKIDIHVVGQHDGIHYYIPAVIGDVKNHTYPDGLYQTGIEMVTQTQEAGHADGSTVEFLGYEILNKSGVYDPSGKNSSVTVTNDYKLIEIIVYDGVLNY